MSRIKSGEFEDVDFDSLGNGLGESSYPLDEVFGQKVVPSNLKGSVSKEATEHGVESGISYNFFPTWRSQIINLLWFFLSSGMTIWVSRYIPKWVVMSGELFTTESTRYELHLPLLVLVPGFFLSKILITIYNSVYTIDETGIEAQVGLVSFNLRQPKLRWEDIRGIEPSQNIWERVLNIGTVKIGSAMTQEAEIVMEGVGNPKGIQLLVNSERAKRLEEMKQSGSALRHEVTGSE